ncbi:MFS transporter [Burkholderia aenigmatica]|uniref:MFS transporter n=1 Tax=Burkholderia aenigmatica TaxID=2015348 RepID=A0ABY6Y615_9BURK|nr:MULTISPECIES: MFS transporter [Burkholderia]UKD14438.1 MFS transporter [Burkholderia aenigmatica]VWD30111.1 MFS transporter [Burkholderia aenigmatica]VWD56794.1 MFS transporter [Burkholderia aenigmatica]
MNASLSSVPRRGARLPLAVFVLGLTVFCIGTTEVMVSGLLPLLAHDFGVSIPSAALLISGYAAGVVVGGPAMTLAFLRTRRKTALLVLLGVFIAGQALGALAQNYALLMTSRVVAALAQGAFFGIGSLLAIDLAGPDAKGRALAVMFGGLTIANIAGAPFGTLIGEQYGWRASFWVVTALAVLSLVATTLVVPMQGRPPYHGIAREFASFRQPRLWAALGISALSQAGLFAAYSYFSPIFTEFGGFERAAVPALQALFGIGCFAGTVVGGRYTDRYPAGILVAGLVALIVTMAAFGALAHSRTGTIVALAAFGIAAFSINPALQARAIAEAPHAPTLATTANTSAFNVGNTVGPWLGGVAINAGLGFVSTVWVGVALAALALVLALASTRPHAPSSSASYTRSTGETS